jgi:hypothetical protein
MHLVMHSIAASGNSDADFVRLMIPHHQAAIDMAKTQLLYGKDAQMRKGAKTQRKPVRSAVALGVFAPLREKFLVFCAKPREIDPTLPRSGTDPLQQ